MRLSSSVLALAFLITAAPAWAEDNKAEPSHGGKTLTQWLKEAGSDSAEARRDAMTALGKLGKQAPKEAVPALVKALEDEDRHVRKGALRAIAEIGPAAKDACPALYGLLGDIGLGLEAVQALEAIGPAAVPTLFKGLKHPDELIRPLCLQKLTLLREGFSDAAALKEHVPTLIAFLKGEDIGPRRWAAKLLEYLGPEAKEAVPALTAALKDSDKFVRSGAAMALSQIGPAAKPAVEELLKALRSKDAENDPEQPVTVTLALWRIDGNARDTVPVLAEVLGREKKEGPFGIRDAACMVLFIIGPEAKPARAALEKALKDKDERVRAIAGFALTRIDHPDRTPLDVLLDGTKSKDVPERGMALETLRALVDHRVISRAEAGKKAVPRLKELQKDSDEGMREFAGYLLRLYDTGEK